jgi:hypothetical protein
MVVRTDWQAGVVHGLYWACRRAPGCTGTRRIKSPDTIRPTAHDASAQSIYEWLQARERGIVQAPAVGGLRGLVNRVMPAPAPAFEAPADDWDTDPLRPLIEHGFVILDGRALPAARVVVDHVLFGPSGVFVIWRKPWPGQLSTTLDSIFIDGRERPTATDEVLRAASALEQTLAHELKPLGASVRAAMLFDQATNKSFEATVGKVMVGGTRGLPKQIRGTAEPILGPETVVRLALAGDRLLD